MSTENEFSKNMERAEAACERYELMEGPPRGYRRINLMMDLLAADGVNGNPPIDWDRLLAADYFNFMHDIGGICRHMNRETGVLGNCFVPRCTLKHNLAKAA
jgi:hypothetical protein